LPGHDGDENISTAQRCHTEEIDKKCNCSTRVNTILSLAIMILKDQKRHMKSAANKPFWEEIPLAEMSEAQWESLCDGCGLCCLVRFEDEDTGEILPTRVHCKLYDPTSCLCSDYENRKTYVPDCVKLTPGAIENLLWMPKSCA
jgi:hypothetical protein